MKPERPVFIGEGESTNTPQITYSKWWFYFNAASWCQHLIEKGYTIR